MPASIGDHLVIFHFQILAFLGFQKVLDVRLYRGHLAHDEDVGTEIEDFLGDVVVNAGDEGDNGDDRSYTDDDTQKRQYRPQLIGPQGLKRHPNGFGVVHGCGVRLWTFGLGPWDAGIRGGPYALSVYSEFRSAASSDLGGRSQAGDPRFTPGHRIE